MRGNEEQIPLYVSYDVLFSPSFDVIISSAYELYADLSAKHESQKDSAPPKDESLNTETSQQGGSSRKDPIRMDDNSRKKEGSIRKKENRSQEQDQSSPKGDSLEGDSSKKEKGSRKQQTKSQKKADNSSKMAKRFKETFSKPDVRVHFIGVWCVSTTIVVCMGL